MIAVRQNERPTLPSRSVLEDHLKYLREKGKVALASAELPALGKAIASASGTACGDM